RRTERPRTPVDGVGAVVHRTRQPGPRAAVTQRSRRPDVVSQGAGLVEDLEADVDRAPVEARADDVSLEVVVLDHPERDVDGLRRLAVGEGGERRVARARLR